MVPDNGGKYSLNRQHGFEPQPDKVRKMATIPTVLTNTGVTKVKDAKAAGKSIALTHLAVGDGNGRSVAPKKTQTALVNQVYLGRIGRLDNDPDLETLAIAELVIPSTVGGWTIREVGVLDDDGDLIAVAKFPATFKPGGQDASPQELEIRVSIAAPRGTTAASMLDSSVVPASRRWVKDHFLSATEGTSGQMLCKESDAANDVEWVDLRVAQAITPDQFGAAGDGADDTAAIQAAIDFARSSSGRKSVDLDGNSYTITSPLVIRDSDSGIRNGKLVADPANFSADSSGSLAMLRLRVGLRMRVKNIEFECNFVANGIHNESRGFNNQYDNLEIGKGKDFGIKLSGGGNQRISHCYITQSGAEVARRTGIGIHVQTADAKVHNTTVSYWKKNVAINGNTTLVSDCHFYNGTPDSI